ncbi:MAG: ABC transporter ATP-binding protein [Acidimicrobiia bacterium]
MRDLTVSYGRIQAVHGISIDVPEGAVVSLLGPNGAGKTTTLRGIAGLQKPITGNVALLGNDITGRSGHSVARQGISLVPEGRRVFPSLTVLDNLRVGATPRLARPWRSPDSLADVFSLFPELSDLTNMPAGLLSGGEQQMLAIGRGLMAQPRLLALDEPSMGLAPQLVERIYSSLEETKRLGTSILLAEQNTHLALELCDWVYVLDTGNIAASGPVNEMRRSSQVAAFYLGTEGSTEGQEAPS